MMNGQEEGETAGYRSFSQRHAESPLTPGYEITNPKPNGLTSMHRAFIALGSNVGDRAEMIEKACNKIADLPQTAIIRTSGLWETKPMYVQEQGTFLNGVCEVGMHESYLGAVSVPSYEWLPNS